MKPEWIFITVFFLLFCTSAHGIQLGLPEITADSGAKITVAISVDDAIGLAGGDLKLLYNPAIIEAKAARVTALATSLFLAANTNIAGEVAFALAGTYGLKGGKGALLEVDFQIKAGASGKSKLELANVALFDEAINNMAATAVNGSVTVKGAEPPGPTKDYSNVFFMIIPEKSELLQNYPNPFNPETWVPFHLKDSAAVSIRIYDSAGQLVRTLDLGYKEAGVYESRSKAVYWNGKNETGEEVASGIYFYTLKAGDFTSTRKMVVKG